MSASPIVDAVVAVHDESRPIDRAVASLSASGLRPGSELRITVVCHNIDPDRIARRLTAFEGAGLRLLPLADGISSAAGPFNAGVEAATGRYVSIMGSDDFLEPEALAAWREIADEATADAVIAPQVHQGGAPVRTPPVRRLHRGALHPLKDRLIYRTAPLGLIARDAVERLELSFTPGLVTGEDQSFSARLWFGGRGLRYASGAPRYVVGADAATRITTTPRPLRDVFAFIDHLSGDDWFATLPQDARRAIAVKFVRVHIVESARVRIEAGAWTADDHACAAGLVERLRHAAPGFERTLAIADRRALDAIVDAGAGAERIAALAQARRRFGMPSTLLTRSSALLAADAPLRFMAASALL